MKKNFDESLRLLLLHEGGYSNHNQDPGGKTRYGITIAVARANGYDGDMRALPMSVAQRIYRARYWDSQRCDDLPSGVDYAMFDYGVNSGIGRSQKVLQRVVGMTPDEVDGKIGPATLKRVNAMDPHKIVNGICDERIAFLRRLVTWPTFGKGWGRRVAEVRSAASRMALDQMPPPPDVEPTPVKLGLFSRLFKKG